MRSSFHWRKTLLPALSLTLFGYPASAQYFGRNKVQYESFKFEILKTEHFDLYYYGAMKEIVPDIGRMAERWYHRLARTLDHQLRGRQVVILYADHPDFEQTNAIAGELGEATGGVTEAFKRRIVLPMAGPLAETDHVLGHELVHAFQYDITGQGRSAAGGLQSLPLWFIEGMAEYLTLGPVDAHTAMWMRDAARDSLPTIQKLNSQRYFPYRWGQAFWSYVGGRWGDEMVGRLLKRAASTRDLWLAIDRTLGLPATTLSTEWREALNQAYDPLVVHTESPEHYGTRFLGGTGRSGDPNYFIAPSLSPDGRQIVFLSERDLFSIDMYLADVQTGQIVRRLVKTATDAHFESLQFINSSGAWSADGKWFVFAGVSKGKPVLHFSSMDPASGAQNREIEFASLGEILNPSWSPDGRSIAFSALVGGVTDLFVYDLEQKQLRRLTNDVYADLQPAWSPDGRGLAFVTDRFGADRPNLRMGNYRLAVMEIGSSLNIVEIQGADEGRNINPQWAPDGQSLYFISDRSGIANIYRVTVPDCVVTQLTNLYGGVSGITALSPALSVASRSGDIAYTPYLRGQYAIYRITDSTMLAGMPPKRPLPQTNPAVLPPVDRPPEGIVEMLEDPVTGLGDSSVFSSRKYQTAISLDYIGQPSLAVGVGPWGSYIGAAGSAFWSDMLGEHNLATALEINGGPKDISAVVAYTNLRNRLNWGIVAQQLTYTVGGFAQGYGTGPTAYVEEVIRTRQINRDVAGLLAYPFNRAQRLEFSGGLSSISFSGDVQTRTYGRSGNRTNSTRQAIDVPDGLAFGEVSAALVFDNSIFGAASPILGQRYRLELSPMVGTINLIEVVADVRKYVMVVRPFTVAGRLLHFGRYGSGGDDPRLQPLFLGYPWLVRGFSYGSFNSSECIVSATTNCVAVQDLLGSRIAVANLELRFPLLGVLGVGSGYYGGLPLEMALFMDAGLAWDGTNEAFFLGGPRRPISSAGAGIRMNFFGFAVIEFDVVRPLGRQVRGWQWQFGFAPGF